MRFLFLCLLLFCSCRRLELERRYVDRSSLASTFVGSPDPMQKMPPTGEQLWVYWNIPVALVQEQLTLTVKVVFRNLEEEKIAYPVARSRGHYVYSLLDDDYRKKGGILAYRAEVTDEEGNVVELITSQMWFKPIKLY